MKRTIDYVIVHCTDSDNPDHDNINTIDCWHREIGFMGGCGYHYLIRKNGCIEIGRTHDEIGAHARGWNEISIGIALSGRDEDKFTKAQFMSLSKLIMNLKYTYNLTNDNILGHNQVNDFKTCPVFSMKKFKNKYL